MKQKHRGINRVKIYVFFKMGQIAVYWEGPNIERKTSGTES